MTQASAYIYSPDDSTLKHLCDVAKSLGVSIKSELASSKDAIEDAASWMIAPDILIIDMAGVEDIPAELNEMAENGPAGQIGVIVISDVSDLRLARKLRSIGVIDYLLHPLQPGDVEDAVNSALASIDSTKLSVTPSKLITVTGASGGTGVSTIAAAIASRLTQRDPKSRVLLLDLDFVSGCQYILHGGDKTPGYINAMREPARIDRVSLERIVLKTHNPRLFFLSEPGDLKTSPSVGDVSTMLAQCTNAFDFVVVDMPRHVSWSAPVFASSSRVFCVARPTLADISHVSEIAESAADDLNDDALIVLVNDVNGIKLQGLRADQFKDISRSPVIMLPHDPITLDREVPEQEMELASGRFSKALKQLDDFIKIQTPHVDKTAVRPVSRFLKWLKE